jgi:hypothetical protein
MKEFESDFYSDNCSNNQQKNQEIGKQRLREFQELYLDKRQTDCLEFIAEKTGHRDDFIQHFLMKFLGGWK